MKLSGYQQYKDSRIPWLGAIPISWTTSPLKFHLDRNDGGVWGDDPDGADDTIVLRSTEQTVDGHWAIEDPAPRRLSATDVRAALLEENDLLVTKSSGSSLHIGKTTIVGSEIARLRCCYSNFMQRLRTSESLRPKYAWYLMNHRIMREQFDLNSNSTTGLANLNASILGAALIAVPPLAEQDSILHFLDRETAKIDALIAKQEQLIATLREDRTATIAHAVTKGLDPAAKMAETGLAWAGRVPATWQTEKVSRVFRAHKSPNAAKLTKEYCADFPGDYPVFSGQTADEGVLARVDFYEFDAGEAGALLSTTVGSKAKFMSVSHIFGRFNLSQNCMAIRPTKNVDMRFFYYCFQALFAYEKNLIPEHMQSSFRMEDLYGFRILFPPIPTQRQIAQYLDERCKQIENLVEKATEVVDTLTEYRSALITDAVTGKIDVRGAA